MHFLFPQFLFALLLTAVPVLIHLFNFRRYKKVVFSDVRFLKSLIEENKKQQTLKKWLILFTRMLLIACLVLAFARPYFPSNLAQTASPSLVHCFYIDNSFSMQALSKDGSLLDISKGKVKQLLNAYPETDLFQLLSNDFEGKHQRLVNKKEFIQMLEELKPGQTHRNFRELTQRHKSLLDGKPSEVFWLSDFQENMAVAFPDQDSSMDLHLIPIQGNVSSNVWIDSAWFAEPVLKIGSGNTLKVMLKNGGETDFENQPMVLKLDGVQKMIQNVSCKKGSSQEISINFPLADSKWHGLSVSLTDYPLTFDDTWFLSAKAIDGLDVLLIQDENRSAELNKVYRLDSFYRVQNVDKGKLNFATFPQQAAIVLFELNEISSGLAVELQKYLKMGGVVAFIPHSKPQDLASIQSFFSGLNLRMDPFVSQRNQVTEVETGDPMFKQVFTKVPELTNLPWVNGYWPFTSTGVGFKTILKLGNEMPLVAKTKFGKGQCFIFANNLQAANGNLSKHALFVPLMLNIPFQKNNPVPASYLIGKQDRVTLTGVRGGGLLQMKLGNETWVLEENVKEGVIEARLNDQMKMAGVYEVLDQGTEISKIALNYSRGESEQGFLDVEQLAEKLHATLNQEDTSVLSASLQNDKQNKQLAYYFLLLALLFLMIETALLRFMK